MPGCYELRKFTFVKDSTRDNSELSREILKIIAIRENAIEMCANEVVVARVHSKLYFSEVRF